MNYAIENGRKLLVQHIFSPEDIKVGSVWAPADGSDYTVEVLNVHDGWVSYRDGANLHEKLSLAFQSRYCLVVEDDA